MSELTIMRAMLNHLEAYVASPVIEVAWPNRRYVPKDDTPYLRVMFLPGPTTRVAASADTSEAFTGSLSVVVSWPANEGPNQAQNIADELRAHYAINTKLRLDGITVELVQPATSAAPIPDHPRYEVPVTIPYVAYVKAA